MERNVRGAGLWLCIALLCQGCQGEECTSDDVAFSGVEEGRTSVAFSVDMTTGASETVTACYTGTIRNLDIENDCTAAIYHFDGEPDEADVPAVVPGSPAPATLPGGGTLVREIELPASMDATLPLESEEGGVCLNDDPGGEEAISKWLVIALCADRDVEFHVLFQLEVCSESGSPGSIGEGAVERLW